jgi:hypothetical protein
MNVESPSPLALVDQIIESFDFSRVQKAMAALGWAYAGTDAPPPIETLKATARRLLENAVLEKHEGVQFHCGGFCASWCNGEALYLTFEITSGHAGPAPRRLPCLAHI